MKTMNFSEFEKKVRTHISQNQVNEAIQLLTEYFQDDKELDEITLQSAKYSAIMGKQRAGVVDALEVDLVLNKLRADILQLLRSKKEYIKYQKLTFGATSSPKNSDKLIKVFFSVASPHNDEQQHYIDALVAYFKANGILLETLKGWNDLDPIVPIMEELKKASGCLVLALERVYVEKGSSKRGSEQENTIENQAFTSSWLHIEAALARAFNIPLIIFKDDALNNEGLIHNDKQEGEIVRINQNKFEEIKQYPIKHFILNWINQVKKYAQENNA